MGKYMKIYRMNWSWLQPRVQSIYGNGHMIELHHVLPYVHQTIAAIAYSKNQQTWKKTRHMKKMENPKKQISKIQKTQKQNNRGKKGNQKGKSKGKNGEQWTCPFAFFCLHLFCFLPGKKNMQKKSKSKKQNNAKQNANGQVHCSPFFFPFLTFLFFPIYFASGFFQFWSFAFWCSMCFPFLLVFSRLKIIRISYGGEQT